MNLTMTRSKQSDRNLVRQLLEKAGEKSSDPSPAFFDDQRNMFDAPKQLATVNLLRKIAGKMEDSDDVLFVYKNHAGSEMT